MLKRGILGVFLLCTLVALQADTVWLADGSILNGQLQMLVDGKAMIKTASAGDLVIAQNQITKIETATALNGMLQNNERLSGQLVKAADGQVAFGAGNPVEVKSIKALWGTGMEDPTLPPPPKGREWSGEVSADIAGKTGNTEKFNGGAGIKASLTGPEDRLMLYVNGSYARENSNTNEKEYRGGIDFERSIANTHNTWFALAEAEKDKYSGIDLQTRLVAGYGYFFFKEDTTQLRLRIGVSYLRKEYTDESTNDAYGLDISLHYERKIEEWGNLVSDITYTPGLNDTEDYRIYHESALDIPLLAAKPISLRLGVSNEYNNLVSDGAKHTDTTYFAKLVYKWK